MKYIDMHCDTITRLFACDGSLRDNDLHVDLHKMVKGECLVQNFAVFTDIAVEDSAYTRKAIAYYHEQLKANEDLIRPVWRFADIAENEKSGHLSAMLTLEDGGVVDDDLAKLDDYYDLGVRMITLTWNYPNGIAYPNFSMTQGDYEDILYQVNEEDGLTDFGKAYIRRMEELGIIIDVSHLSDAGFYDVCALAQKPFVASHSNARSICGVARNLSDEMIRMLADKGGVMGLNYCSAFIEDGNDQYASIDGMVEHIRHIVKVGGIDCVGLGSDFDGIDNELEIKDCSGMPLLYERLQKYFTEEEIEKIFYGNVLRVYKACLN